MKNYIKFKIKHITYYYEFSGKIYNIIMLKKQCIIDFYIDKNENKSTSCYIVPSNGNELYYNNHAYRNLNDLKNIECIINYNKTITAIDNL